MTALNKDIVYDMIKMKKQAERFGAMAVHSAEEYLAEEHKGSEI